MPRLATIITVMSLASCAAAYGSWGPFHDLPSGINIQAAKIAEERGDLARAQGDYTLAVVYYEKALRSNREDPTLYNKLGIAQLKLKETNAARKTFLQAIKYDPRNASALNNLGATLCIQRKYKPALRYMKQALELDESNASFHVNMAEVWSGLGQIDRAMTEYARALELNPDIFTSGEAGMIAQVRSPEQRARMDFLIAKAYAKRGNLDGALDHLRRAKDGHYPHMADVYTDQEFAVLWQDPRLQKIVKR